jgi:hypothetical protein
VKRGPKPRRWIVVDGRVRRVKRHPCGKIVQPKKKRTYWKAYWKRLERENLRDEEERWVREHGADSLALINRMYSGPHT